MATLEENTSEKTARRRGSGGDLQSKGLSNPDAGAADAAQQSEDEHQPEASDQTTAAN
jgi:hypothetical protein